jgi:predicted  nucleic acid-binding Zn-ribbon protein
MHITASSPFEEPLEGLIRPWRCLHISLQRDAITHTRGLCHCCTTQGVLQRQHIQQLEASVAALTAAKEDLQSAKGDLEHQVQHWNSNYCKLQKDCDALQEKCKGLEEMVSALTVKRQQSAQKYVFLQTKHNALCEEFKKLTVKLQRGDKAEKDAEVSVAQTAVSVNGAGGALHMHAC